MLMGVLSTALTPYNNDLYASNLTGLPILAVHGGDDDNVPPRHSRQHVALVQAWKRDCKDRLLVEVGKKGHWWDDVLKLPEVYDFIDMVTKGEVRDWTSDREQGFTLTTVNPDECGGRSGVQILDLRVPGRLARLDVIETAGQLEVKGTNVARISYQSTRSGVRTKYMVTGPGCRLAAIPDAPASTAEVKPLPPVNEFEFRRRHSGPMVRLLDSAGPIAVIVDPSQHRCYSIALRYAHDLFVYHRLSFDILTVPEARSQLSQGGLRGNVVMIGRPDQNEFVRDLVSKEGERPFAFVQGGMTFNDQEIDDKGAGESRHF